MSARSVLGVLGAWCAGWGLIIGGLMSCAALPASPYPSVATQDAGVVRLECIGARGPTSGSAVHLGDGRYVTAAHVVADTVCQIGPNAIALSHFDEEADFAMFDAAPADVSLEVSCRGFKPGEHYLARGYAFGNPFNARLPWIASPFTGGPRRDFLGDAIPGMSGGPVLDRKGRVVGVVLQRLPASALPLAATPVCA